MAFNLIHMPTNFCFDSCILEYGAKRFGCKVEDVRKVMIARISNVVKAEKAKEKAAQTSGKSNNNI